ncbi:hypothetical protein [Anaerorhabdus furcosa]|uniref:Uncharacterized protein n=1 Tax=Anaerorhabdus furcosa TaxID=118967 RepID=A0A1T4Q4U3_9FIRM|nr:hypothetical protein [Anaerorhabdus furcosa]SJZ98696.1 hypothetical protein SAMN02745191_2315 [Anaerorhabdus furcosa]
MKKIICLVLSSMLIASFIMPLNLLAEQGQEKIVGKEKKTKEVIQIGEEILIYYLNVEEGLLFTVEGKEGINEFYKYNDYIYEKVNGDLIIINKIDTREIERELIQPRSTWSSYTQLLPVLVNLNYTNSPATAVALAASAIGVWPGLITSWGSLIVDSLNSPQYVYISYSMATYSQCSILTSKTDIKLFKAIYDGSSWSKGTQTGSTITKKSYFWVGDPSNYGYPAACRALTTSYPYQSGAM